MFRRSILAAFALSTLSAGAAAQAPQIPPAVAAAANGIDKAQLDRDVDYLASDAPPRVRMDKRMPATVPQYPAIQP